NRLHLFSGDYGRVSEGRGARARNRDGEKICLGGHSLAFRLEIWSRENFRPQPIRVTNRASPASRLRVTADGCLRRHTQPIVIPNESRGIAPCKLPGKAAGVINSASMAFWM